MADVKDPLDELFVKEDQTVSTEMLRDLLRDFAQLSPEGKIFLLPKFNGLKNVQKVLVILLAKKALAIKLNQEELTAPSEVQTITGLPRGTVNPTLTDLATRRLVSNKEGKYIVPNYVVTKIAELFKNG